MSSSGDNDGIVIKYSPAGEELWKTRYNGTGNNSDQFTSIELDKYGNIYAAGIVTGPTSSSDFIVVKYDNKGEKLWSSAYNGSANENDAVKSLCLDIDGNILVTGFAANEES